MKLIIATCFYDNISLEVRDAHRRIVDRFKPANAEYLQVLTNHHGLCMTHLTRSIAKDEQDAMLVWLDIDAIPLSPLAFTEPFLHANFWGCAQRANHIENNAHIYAGPFAMGFTTKTYRFIDMPAFVETSRGDVGEELTYQYESHAHRSPYFLFPTAVGVEKWKLTDKLSFGHDTVYGSKEHPAMFYHAFEARHNGTERFLLKCLEVEQ